MRGVFSCAAQRPPSTDPPRPFLSLSAKTQILFAKCQFPANTHPGSQDARVFSTYETRVVLSTVAGADSRHCRRKLGAGLGGLAEAGKRDRMQSPLSRTVQSPLHNSYRTGRVFLPLEACFLCPRTWEAQRSGPDYLRHEGLLSI